MALVSNIKDNDWASVRQAIARLGSTKLGVDANPAYAGLTLTGLTASRLISSDANKTLSSVSDLTSWIAGTTNQITVTDDSDGTITLSTPQNIHTGASPTFAGLTITSTGKINLRDAAIGIYSQADTFMDLFADGGVRIGDSSAGAPTNYTHIEPDGTLEFNGTATVWNDLQFSISRGKVPAVNNPTWETFTTNTNEFSFAVDDYIDLEANEVPHSWKLGSHGNVHLHVTTKAANATGSDRFAKFTVYIGYCDTGEAWQETSFTAELTIPDGTAALEMFYLDMGDLTLTNYVLEAEIKPRVKRIAATGGTEYAGNIFLTQIGIHLEDDTVGSRAETTK